MHREHGRGAAELTSEGNGLAVHCLGKGTPEGSATFTVDVNGEWFGSGECTGRFVQGLSGAGLRSGSSVSLTVDDTTTWEVVMFETTQESS